MAQPPILEVKRVRGKVKSKIEKFEDLAVWQKAEILAINIYKTFKTLKDYSFRDQIQSAAVSIMNNIAEGYERRGNKEYSKFLFIAKGSCGETRSMLHLALKLGSISKTDYFALNSQAIEISKMLYGLIKKL